MSIVEVEGFGEGFVPAFIGGFGGGFGVGLVLLRSLLLLGGELDEPGMQRQIGECWLLPP